MSHLHRSSYRILDATFVLESDSIEFSRLFDEEYGTFRTLDEPCIKNVRIKVNVNNDVPAVTIDNQLFPLNHYRSPLTFARNIILKEILQLNSEFIILHAGVVSRDNRAVILSGPPGIGKTTLVTKLLEAGYSFLSDDYCPIHKKTGAVHPFPRSLWKMPDETEKRSSLSADMPPCDLRKKKISINPERLDFPIAMGPCRPACLICLESPSGNHSTRHFEIGFKKGGETAFIDDLDILIQGTEKLNTCNEDTPLITIQCLLKETDFSEWRVSYRKGCGLTGPMKDLFAKHAQDILDVYKVDIISYNFKNEPVLKGVTSHRAAFYLLNEFKQDIIVWERHNGESAATAGGFFAALTETINEIPAYRLTIGNLSSMVKLIDDLMTRK